MSEHSTRNVAHTHTAISKGDRVRRTDCSHIGQTDADVRAVEAPAASPGA
jgi:hypothetical protein